MALYLLNSEQSHLEITRPNPDVAGYERRRKELQEVDLPGAQSGGDPKQVEAVLREIDDMNRAIAGELILDEQEVAKLSEAVADGSLHNLGFRVNAYGITLFGNEAVREDYLDMYLRVLIHTVPGLFFSGALVLEPDDGDYYSFRRLVIEGDTIRVQTPSYIVWEDEEQ